MRILKIAIYTLLIGLFSIFAFGIIKEGNMAVIKNILYLVPFVLGLYLTISGIFESIKDKIFRKKIIYGIILSILGLIFDLYMGLRELSTNFY